MTYAKMLHVKMICASKMPKWWILKCAEKLFAIMSCAKMLYTELLYAVIVCPKMALFKMPYAETPYAKSMYD